MIIAESVLRSTSRVVWRAVIAIALAATLAFFALRAVPGDALTAQLRESGASDEVIAERRAALGLDAPLSMQYSGFMLRLLRGDLGVSLLDGRTVAEILVEQIPETLELATAAMLVAILLGFIMGVAAAVPNALSAPARGAIALGLSTPIFFTGPLAITIFATWLDLLPAGGAGRFDQLVLPAALLGFHSAAPIAQVVRASLETTLNEPFILAAEGRGLTRLSILFRHALRASLAPAISVAGLETGFLLGGAIITETVFSRPGIGKVMVDSALRQDYPVVQGVVVWSAALYIGLTALGDAVAAMFDPRLRGLS
ncbi:MAG: ABC transporter permease [Chloroflexi bacterium]|nr:ABC transporter permease [Chloroflexota bacterium]